MKKKFLPSYFSARLVRGKSRWYVNVYFTVDGELQQKKPTFNLNRETNIPERIRRGEELVRKINWWLSKGMDFPFDEIKVPSNYEISLGINRPERYDTNVIEALSRMVELRCNTDRPDSNRGYRSLLSLFTKFLEKYHYDNYAVADITKAIAEDYFDHIVVDRKVGARTHNNDLGLLKGFFKMLLKRGYIANNPFEDIDRKRNPKKNRRNFSLKEAKAVVLDIQKTDPLLFQAFILQYCCFIRPAEMRRLRFRDIDIKNGLVYISESQSKVGKERVVTIPDSFAHLIDRKFFSSHPENSLIFGYQFKPHLRKPCGRNEMNRRHRVVLDNMILRGILDDVTGLTWYSWKDTGITDALYEIDPSSVQDQAGHSSLDMTLKYKHQRPENIPMKKGFKNKLL